MRKQIKRHDATRRDFLITSATVGLGVSLSSALSTVLAATRSDEFERAYQALTKGAKPIEEKVKLEIDPYIENGAMVFYRVSVDHPMLPDNYVKTLHLLSTENPFAHVARFHFTPNSGRAAIAGRMRLAKTQDVVAIAELSNDQLYSARRYVEVAVGGCES